MEGEAIYCKQLEPKGEVTKYRASCGAGAPAREPQSLILPLPYTILHRMPSRAKSRDLCFSTLCKRAQENPYHNYHLERTPRSHYQLELTWKSGPSGRVSLRINRALAPAVAEFPPLCLPEFAGHPPPRRPPAPPESRIDSPKAFPTQNAPAADPTAEK